MGSTPQDTAKALTAGAIAGALSRTATAPLERLKVMRQVQAKSTGTLYTRSIAGSLYDMVKKEGFLSMWKGNGTNVARIAPSSALQFSCFDMYKRILIPDDSGDPILTLIAGGAAGATASTICYPLDLTRSFLSVQTDRAQYRGIFGTMAQIAKNEGVVGLYRGLVPTLLGIAPYIAFNFVTFDQLKRRFMPSRDHPQYDLINLSLGAVAGGVASTLTYPTDLIRRRVQLQGFQGFDIPRYNGMWDCIVKTVQQEGVQGLYKGMVPCWLKVIPSMAIAFATYEGLRKRWKFNNVQGVSKS